MGITAGDSVTLEYTGRLDDGTVFDTSREAVAEEAGLAEQQADREYDPLTVEIGEGQIIEGLEDDLVGMEEGDSASISVPPESGYGERTEERVVEYDRAEMDEALGDEQPREGMHVRGQGGQVGEIVAVDEESVAIDFNHELAGETLTFDVEILDVE
ncbi:MAG: peptidylprolyl isomerase [Halobacteriaceae archaeon]